MSSHLNSVAMLVDFSVSQWTARKIDKAKSREVNTDAHASEKASHVSKKLIDPAVSGLAAISNCKDRAYQRHAELTLPWSDKGPRVLSAAMFDTYQRDMEQFEAEFYPLVRTFVANYPDYVEHAKSHLGDLFNDTDYPKASRIEAKFAWRIQYMQLPDAADFRVDIGEASVARIKSQIEQRLNDTAAGAVRDVFERVHDVVAAMVEKLTAFDPAKSGKERGTFRDSLVENARDLVAILPGLNFTADPRITMLANKLTALVSHDAETLRESDNIRASVATQAAEIVQAVSDFMA